MSVRVYVGLKNLSRGSLLGITKACRVMINVDPDRWIFLSNHTRIMDPFLAHHCFYLFIYFKISFQKSQDALRCTFT